MEPSKKQGEASAESREGQATSKPDRRNEASPQSRTDPAEAASSGAGKAAPRGVQHGPDPQSGGVLEAREPAANAATARASALDMVEASPAAGTLAVSTELVAGAQAQSMLEAAAAASLSSENIAGTSETEAAAGAEAGPAALAGVPAALAALLGAGAPGTSTHAEATSMPGTRSAGPDGKTPLDLPLTPSTRRAAELERGLTPSATLLQGNGTGLGADTTPGHPGQGLASEAGALDGFAVNTHAAHPLLRHTAAPSSPPQLPVHTPAGQQTWAEDVGQQVRWMLGRAESKAELVLTPPNLGKLEVSISFSGDQTTAQFVASSQAARDALERAMPQLREILQQAGINLGEANVSTSDQRARDEAQAAAAARMGDGADGAGTDGARAGGTTAPHWVRQHDGMVDTFA